MFLSWPAVIAILYFFYDVNYFLKIIIMLPWSFWSHKFQKRTSIFEESTLYGICAPQDVDIFFTHMNNSRYLRELDFALYHFYGRNGFYNETRKNGGVPLQGASSIRYRRALSIFSLYKITTRLIYWDEKNVYTENKYTTLSDDFVRAIVISKQTIHGLEFPVSVLIEKIQPGAKELVPPKELTLWLDSMEESSKKLKKQI